MILIMVGSPTCSKCKKVAPEVEEYCNQKGVGFMYTHVSDASSSILKILESSHVRQAPAFVIFNDEDTVVSTYEDLYNNIDNLVGTEVNK